jgi:hypothetical protein
VLAGGGAPGEGPPPVEPSLVEPSLLPFEAAEDDADELGVE